MKNKWLIPVVLFFVLLICYIIRGLIGTRITVEMLQTDKIEESISGQGVLIKNENVSTVALTGMTEIYVRNGQRVSNGEVLSTIYGETADESVKTQLADVNKKINAIKGGNSGDAVFINDATKIESEITEYVDEVIAKASEQDMALVSEYKYRISTMADQKAVAKGEKEGFSNTLVQLQAEKSVLESKIGKIQTVLKADMPGIFIEGSDGFESSLTPSSFEKFTPSVISEVIHRDKNDEVMNQEDGSYTYKIVDNYFYYLAMNIDKTMSEKLAVGDSVKLRFEDFSAADCPVVIRHISEPDAKGQRTVVVECRMYVDKLLEKRVVNVTFVKKSVSGYKVSIEHLHTVDNAVGLFIKRGAVMKFIPVNIVYSTEEEAIVSAASNSKPIKSYDEVVTSAPEFYDGRVIVSQ